MASINKASKALLFIPDISGFTEFVHFTEISHSKHIIAELLEVLLSNNNMDLRLAEIEGDALFFYKEVEEVNLDELENQIIKMYKAFHTHLKRYEYERICSCGACSSAYNLTLKFVSHFGTIEFIQVKDIVKPFGSDVIKVHRLLKNDVPIYEYALYTNDLCPKTNISNKLTSVYDFGTISYNYKELSKLKNELPYVPPIPEDVPKHKLFSVTKSVNAPILDLYEMICNFDYRLLWVKDVDKMDYQKNMINRIGTTHKCLIGKNTVVNQKTITKKAESNQLVYGESTTDVPFINKLNVYYVLEEKDNNSTKILIEAYANFKPFGIIMKGMISKKLKNSITAALNELILLLNSGFNINNQNFENENNK